MASDGSSSVRKILLSASIAMAFVGALCFARYRHIWTPAPLYLLIPGILVGALVPDSGFNPVGDLHPWGVYSQIVVYSVNVLLYSLLVYLFLLVAQPNPRSKE
jgi:hypothetical protein